MARGIEGNEISTKTSTPAQKTSQSSNMSQKTLFGFFQRKQVPTAPSTSQAAPDMSSPLPVRSSPRSKASIRNSTANLTPAPSSDAIAPSSPLKDDRSRDSSPSKSKSHGLPSPITPASTTDGDTSKGFKKTESDVTERRSKRNVNYAESGTDDSEDEAADVFKPVSATAGRALKRRKIAVDSDDEFGIDAATEDAMAIEDDLDDFIAPDDSEDEPVTYRRKAKKASKVDQTDSQTDSKSPPPLPKTPTEELEIPATSTAQQWTFDPENPESFRPRTQRVSASSKQSSKKQKVHGIEPEKRYEWLATIHDRDRHPPGHPDYDPRTIYIPPMAWNKFSPFEKQYWEIKQNFWDTIVFFKKGKFYELYENDATIGHQLFDLKLTDRVNMRMVGVPEASLDHWANQFVAKGFKIARVDQMESALAKEMRERDDKPSERNSKPQKEDKIIRRELASVLTSGTLVDGGMLQNEMATYCVAIKEIEADSVPAFGIAFVDTATAKFHLVEFVDDTDMTKFETFVAQIRPGELLLEKSRLSTRALRILKNNTAATTIWNYLKPNKEFWPADITCREVDASGYFSLNDEDGEALWPKALSEAKDKEMVMSAFGALLQYLKTLKIDRDLVSLGNFSWYDPIRRGSTLVLDGQSLINLEIFANSVDGGVEGTLFSMLNHCVSPSGKRMLKQWLCHPLVDANKINARLDAVDALMADRQVTDRFTSSLTKLPDLERLISRIHAKRCKAQEFVKVLEGFEQIEYTMSLLGSFGEGEGLIGKLITSMPDLAGALSRWKDAFDRQTAKEQGYLVPAPGVEEAYDESAEAIQSCEDKLQRFLREARKQLNSTALCFRDNGKEIYQLEVPIKIRSVPSDWDQMSATAKCKRYYTPELRKLVRDLQEARETHAQVVKEVAGHFYARFDEDYSIWLAAVNIIAQLDCLIALARASQSIGAPSCRPEFIDDDDARATFNFTELRHPTMLTTVSSFIPNDITLGGTSCPKLSLLTGANAAGKSTVLRMTCIAVILAQLGCHVPCATALLTPCDRIMSRLGANDNILQQQSTFYVELAETKKILSEATPRSLVILDELGRGTSSVDGLAVAEAVLHYIAGSVGCTGFFATHYHALAHEFSNHPEVKPMRMAIDVDEAARRVTFLYKLEDGVAEGSFGMHCASMCGIPVEVVKRAEEAAGMWEHSGRVQERIEHGRKGGRLALGWASDIAWCLKEAKEAKEEASLCEGALEVLRKAVELM